MENTLFLYIIDLRCGAHKLGNRDLADVDRTLSTIVFQCNFFPNLEQPPAGMAGRQVETGGGAQCANCTPAFDGLG